MEEQEPLMRESFEKIYRHHSQVYQRLVEREDHQGNLLTTLKAVCAFAPEMRVIEMGAGTGRITHLIAPLVAEIHAFDAAPAMVALGKELTERAGFENVRFEVGAHDSLVADPSSADLLIEGWAFGHLFEGDEQEWTPAFVTILAQMERLLKPGGMAVAIETLGTGRESPVPPNPALAWFYAQLEENGFERNWCRTDYQFNSKAEGQELLGFFFGPEMAQQYVDRGDLSFPECTGVWWKRFT
jgi:ubiquinone/menaquinone biosynthesis C-methylase UbiE